MAQHVSSRTSHTIESPAFVSVSQVQCVSPGAVKLRLVVASVGFVVAALAIAATVVAAVFA